MIKEGLYLFETCENKNRGFHLFPNNLCLYLCEAASQWSKGELHLLQNFNILNMCISDTIMHTAFIRHTQFPAGWTESQCSPQPDSRSQVGNRPHCGFLIIMKILTKTGWGLLAYEMIHIRTDEQLLSELTLQRLLQLKRKKKK